MRKNEKRMQQQRTSQKQGIKSYEGSSTAWTSKNDNSEHKAMRNFKKYQIT